MNQEPLECLFLDVELLENNAQTNFKVQNYMSGFHSTPFLSRTFGASVRIYRAPEMATYPNRTLDILLEPLECPFLRVKSPNTTAIYVSRVQIIVLFSAEHTVLVGRELPGGGVRIGNLEGGTRPSGSLKTNISGLGTFIRGRKTVLMVCERAKRPKESQSSWKSGAKNSSLLVVLPAIILPSSW